MCVCVCVCVSVCAHAHACVNVTILPTLNFTVYPIYQPLRSGRI